jgi:hypothetical protein
MNTTPSISQCLAFINCHMQAPKLSPKLERPFVKCVTISRQAGCAAHVFSEELAAHIHSHLPPAAPRWTIFDRDLVEAVLQDQHLPARLARFMPEDKVAWINDVVEDLFSLHPPTETLVRRTSETILHLAELGGVIIVGRGANIITASLPGVIHVRLIGSIAARVGHMEHFDHLSRKEALQRIEREDEGRRRYLKKYFHKEIDDPLLYHLVINTDVVPPIQAAHAVGDLVLNHVPGQQMALPKAA